jgi:hypothetical protein
MKTPPKQLLKNIYYMALYHRDKANLRMNDLLREDELREKDEGLYNAYAYVVQMIEYHDSIGLVDYKKVHNIKAKFPETPTPITAPLEI